MTISQHTIFAMLSLDLDQEEAYDLVCKLFINPALEALTVFEIEVAERFKQQSNMTVAQAIALFQNDAAIVDMHQRLIAQDVEWARERRRSQLRSRSFLEVKQRCEALTAELNALTKTQEEMIELGLDKTEIATDLQSGDLWMTQGNDKHDPNTTE